MSRVSAGQAMTCQCGAEMRLRDGKYGKFWGCSTFPKCRQTRRYNGAEVNIEKEHEPSKYQLPILNFVKSEPGHLVATAGAGSGKTWTIVQALKYTDPKAEVAFVAFNRHIANTLAGKAPQHVHVSTLHSLGYGNVRNALGNVKVEPKKVYYIVKDLMDSMPFEQGEIVAQNIPTVTRLVSMCKGLLLDPTTENLAYITDRWNIETNGDRDLLFDVATEAYGLSVEQDVEIDYDDMIFYCATGRVPCKQFDVLFVDETQDLNKAQLEMAVRSIKPDGRIIAVGDPNQSIYGFRGADTEAVPNIIARLEATVLPLSITYRCPKSHVALANTLVPELEAADWAEDGVLENVSEYTFLDKVKPGDLVLCRCNAPLVRPAFSLIRQGVKAVILGRDIGKGLMALVTKIQKRNHVHSLEDTLEKLAEYERKEHSRLVKAGKELQADLLTDKIDTIYALCDGCYTTGDLERRIETVFADDAVGVTFSTVHKAKGGEADNVYILRSDLMPHPKATADWEVTQEWNIMYVAFTRAKKGLYFVGGGAPFTTDDDANVPLHEMSDEEIDTWYDGEGNKPSLVPIDEHPAIPAPVAEVMKEMIAPDVANIAAKLEGEPLEQKEHQHQAILDLFPKEGRFEKSIYRPSAHDFVNAMPDWTHEIDAGQLVMSRHLGGDSTVKVYTSVKVGQIADGTGEDSIRVVREDTRKRDGQVFRFKNQQDWITRSVPKGIKTNQAATAHLVAKIDKQIAAFTRDCPDCDGLQVKCRQGSGENTTYWWRGLECRHSTW